MEESSESPFDGEPSRSGADDGFVGDGPDTTAVSHAGAFWLTGRIDAGAPAGAAAGAPSAGLAGVLSDGLVVELSAGLAVGDMSIVTSPH